MERTPQKYFLVLFTFVSFRAMAYVPPVEFLFQEWPRLHHITQPVQISYDGAFLKSSGSPSLPFTEEVFLTTTGTIRIDIKIGEQTLSYLRKDQKAGLFLGRVPVKQTDSKDGLQLFSLMYPASHAKLLQRFESLSLLSSSDLERAKAGTKSDPKSALEWRNKVKFFMYGQGFISYVIPAADNRALLLDQASLMPVGIVPKSKPEGNLTLGFRVHEVGALEIPGGQLYYPQNLSLHDHDMIVHLHAKKITQAPTMDVKLVDLDHVNKTATSGDASLSDQARTLSELLMKFF